MIILKTTGMNHECGDCEHQGSGFCRKRAPIKINVKDWGCEEFSVSIRKVWDIQYDSFRVEKRLRNAEKIKRKLRAEIKKLKAETCEDGR